MIEQISCNKQKINIGRSGFLQGALSKAAKTVLGGVFDVLDVIASAEVRSTWLPILPIKRT
jgi:hypothetical protein